MSKKSTTATIQNKNFILAAVFGFGGMLTAILASIAVVTPLVNAQVNSALALQASHTAQLSSAQVQPVHSVTSDSCSAPAQNTKVTNEAPTVTVKGGHGAGIYKTSMAMDWKKSPYMAHVSDSYNNSGNTTTNTYTTNTTNTTNNSTVNKNSNNIIGSHNTETANKTNVKISVKDSFNKDSYNTEVTNDVTIKDSFNKTVTKDSYNTATLNSNNLNSGNVASGNTVTLTDKSTTVTNNVENTVKDSFNTVNSNNDILSHNKVDVDVNSNNTVQKGLVNVDDSKIEA